MSADQEKRNRETNPMIYVEIISDGKVEKL
jgi:hypothetical protein